VTIVKLPAAIKIDSTTSWLRSVPDHWQVRKLKHVADIRFSNVDKRTDDSEEIVFLCNYLDVYRNNKITLDIDFMPASADRAEINKFALHVGDVLVTKDSERPDDIAIAAVVVETKPNLLCGYHLALIRPAEDVLDGTFLNYLFASKMFRLQFETQANGVTRFGLSQDAFKNSVIPLPAIHEQRLIASFLDRETAKLDQLVEKKQRLIELLQEKRQALITQAVTKGLDPNVPMKDSGIPWLGEVPAHWDVWRLKHSIESLVNGVWGDEAQGDDNDTLCVRVADFNRRNFTVTLSNPTYRNVSLIDRQKRQINKGDLLLERSGGGDLHPVGFVVQYQHDQKAICSNFISVLRPTQRSFSSYFKYVHAMLYAFGVNRRSIKQTTGIQNFDAETYLNELVPFPPYEEQVDIANFLEIETKKIDDVIANLEIQIEKITEYRQALITAAVTGQIDVRQYVADEAMPVSSEQAAPSTLK